MPRLKLRLGMALGNEELQPLGGVVTNIYLAHHQGKAASSRPPALTIPVGWREYVYTDVPEGRYVIEAILPSGTLVNHEVTIDGPTVVDLRFEGSGELLGWQSLLGNFPDSANYAATDLNPWARAAALVAIAQTDRPPQLSERIRMLAADLDGLAQVWVLTAIPYTSRDDRERLLAVMEAASTDLDLGALGEILEAIIHTNSQPDMLERLLSIIEAATGLGPEDRARLLVSMADAHPPSPVLERLLSITEAATGLRPEDRARLLVCIADAHPPSPVLERLLSITEAASDYHRPYPPRARLMVSIANANPPPQLLERLLSTASAPGLNGRDRAMVLEAIAHNNPAPDVLERILTVIEAAPRLEYGSSVWAGALVSIARSNPPPDVLERILAVIEAAPRHRYGSWNWAEALVSIARSNPQPNVIERIRRAATELLPSYQANVLVAIARPNDRARILAEIEAAAVHLDVRDRPGVLMAVARGNPPPEVQERLIASIAHLRSPDRAWLLAAIAETKPSPEMLDRILATTTDLSPSGRATVLRAIAETNPSPKLLERILTAVTNLSRIGGAKVLMAVANTHPSAELLGRVLDAESSSTDLFPDYRAQVLVAVANTHPSAELLGRVLDAESSRTDLSPDDRAQVLVAVANTHPSRQILERVRMAATRLPPSIRPQVLEAIAQADPNDGGRVLASAETTCAQLALADRVKLLTAIAKASPDNRGRLLTVAESAQTVKEREGRPVIMWLDDPVHALAGPEQSSSVWRLLAAFGTSSQGADVVRALSESQSPVVLAPIQVDVLPATASGTLSAPVMPGTQSDRSSGFQLLRLTSDGPVLPSGLRPRSSGGRKFLIVSDSYGGVTLASLPFPWASEGGQESVVEVLVDGNLTPHSAGRSPNVAVSVRDPVISAALGYLARDAFPLARYFTETAQNCLRPKGANPLAAAAAGYLLVGSTRDEEAPWHQWIDNLADRFEWMPDGAILQARLRLQLSRGREENLGLARQSLRRAFQRGLPYYGLGLQWLVEGLTLFEDENMAILRTAVSQAAWKVDLQQPFTVLNLSYRSK